MKNLFFGVQTTSTFKFYQNEILEYIIEYCYVSIVLFLLCAKMFFAFSQNHNNLRTPSFQLDTDKDRNCCNRSFVLTGLKWGT